MSLVTEIPAASSYKAVEHFMQRLSAETDCADVAAALRSGDKDFVLLHVIGEARDYERRHIPGSIHIPHRYISAEKLSEWPEGTMFVTYCAGPHCNGADQAALKIARLGRPVKVMIGGMTGWEDEGLPFASGRESGDIG
ncbi:rhodanese-like domain-containing protein [Halomonas elongata]|uniref:Rhodanese domain protein n=1 Tax=Halomonas elongata (strain ATCC 33173 / DSM 2581 / NBRC 15536 / NCIMB 2198 / 1H9) TaxID=768066 RepID=A0A1R4A4B8_HALED|nr:rhodanese-like domain-containing protein [Halomonas elongata]RAW06670.1 rhodanese [Halomonas elongata]WBF18895.1 rhodanese-like domain-containing protein [Halomonas elongata]WPU47754.1 rhodanese-like domain-containing protein [Halomonas elongata DSM 2581]SJK83750.1 rhodanese domain protein [Halomonas elongata DSM 2581]